MRFTSKLQSSSAGQEEENEAVFICVCDCHVGAANDMAVREGPCVHQHLWTTRTGWLPAGPALEQHWWHLLDWNTPVPLSLTSDTSYSKQKKVLPKAQMLLSRAASFPRNL